MGALSFQSPPESLCILRLSAIGDVTHMLPVVASLKQQWPQTRLTWVIGKIEYQLVKSLADVEFIIFDKKNGLAEYATLRKKLKDRRFDVLLMMQVALRANLISLLIKADIKIGYDQKRARDFHRLFSNQSIEGPVRVHVLDTFFQFLEKLGIAERTMDWLLKADDDSAAFAEAQIGGRKTIVINPCSSARANNFRNWPEPNYVRVIDYLMGKGFHVVLSGGPDAEEQNFAERVSAACEQPPLNLVGKTNLMQLLALLEQSVLLVAPDTGPAHMGTAAGIPVVGLYASSNPSRTGPYNSRSISVNAYPYTLQTFKQKTVDQANWGERVRNADVMGMITVESVIKQLDQCLPDNPG
jgi:heptosyltransferase I